MARRAANLAWMIALAAAAVVFTAMIVRYSQRHGRLMLFPTFDDTRNMLDALRAHHALRDGGPLGLVGHWLTIPPHSPYQATLGMLGFTLLGVHDWAAPAASAILIIALLAAARWAMRGLPWAVQLALLLFVLTLPLAGVGVYEFRPDIAAGITLAFAATWTLWRPLARSPARHQLAVGAMFGMCLLIKPPFFPLILITFALCIALKSIEAKGKPRIVHCLTATSARCLLGCLVVAGPYWLVAGRAQWRYFYDVSFGRYRGLWNLPGDEHLQPFYYLSGEGARVMLGGHLVPLVIMCLAGLGLVLIRRRRREIAFAMSMAVVAAVLYLVPTASRKSPFFGVPFQMMLVFGALLSARLAWFVMRPRSPRRPPFARAALATGLAVLSLLLFRWPENRGDYDSPEIQSRRSIVRYLFAPIAARAAIEASPPRVFVASAGDVTARLLDYLALKDDLRIDAFDHPNESSLDMFRRSIDESDFVIASESGSDLVARNLPSAKVQDQVLHLLRHDSRFREITHQPFIRTGRGYYLFERSD